MNAVTGWGPAVYCYEITDQVCVYSKWQFCHVMCFHPPGPLGFGEILPKTHFFFCVVRRQTC